jgi:hypothetical protein
MSLKDLDNMTGYETPEEIDALLAQLESEELELDDDAEIESTDTEELKADKTGDSVNPEDDEDQNGEGKGPNGVFAKDDKNIIPYDVLEREREEKRRLQEELEQFKSRESEWQTKDRLFELRNKQLEELGVNPADLPENFKVTDEELDILAEDYPEIGKVIRHLVAKVNTFEASSESQSKKVSSNPVADAIAENSDLSAWSKENGELWSKAQDVDDQLRSDPKWQHKPIAERFAEVARVVKETANAQKASSKAKQSKEEIESLPSSPSEVGHTVSSTASPQERLANGSEAEIQAMFSSMSEAQIEALLSEFED